MGLLPAPATATTSGPTPEDRRREFDELSLRLRRHASGEEEMDSRTYSEVLKRSIDLAASFNQTTAGPKKTNKKIGVGKAAPLSLSDL